MCSVVCADEVLFGSIFACVFDVVSCVLDVLVCVFFLLSVFECAVEVVR